MAGRIRHQGRFTVLIPRELDMMAAGKKIPIPRRKPVLPEKVATNVGDGNTETENRNAKQTETPKRSSAVDPISTTQKPLQQSAPKSTLRPGQ
jgi:hypothetical protein